MSKLAIIQLDDYRREDLRAGFRTAFAELGLADLFQPNEDIIIKPNLLSGVAPDRAVTPHPEVFRALILSLRDLRLDLAYGDSPALDSPEKAARLTGLQAIANEYDLPLADFVNVVETPMPAGKVMRHLHLARGVAEADGLVSLAKLKTHALTGLTGAIKNQFGVIPGQRKAACHAAYPILKDFAQMLVDITRQVKPRLYVLDGIVAMEGNGPRNGRPRQVGAVLLSRDPVAIDAAAAVLIGLDPQAIVTTWLAARDGLGTFDLQKIETCLIRPGDGAVTIQNGCAAELLPAMQIRDFVKGRIARTIFTKATSLSAPIYKKHVMRRPRIIESNCTRCGVCVGACPAEPRVLWQETGDSIPRFDYARCIRCFCCQEVCPYGAIDVQPTILGRVLDV
jgi:uncharacterized protein (DUF362 family)/ferredoxin